MRKYFSMHRPDKEMFEGVEVMADPEIHGAVADELVNQLQKGARILEIGAGAGAFTKRLYNLGFDVHAIDVDDSNFKLEEVSLRKVEPDARLTELYEAGSFDAIVAVEVIEHLKSTSAFLEDAKHLLASEGKLFITTPNISSFYSRIVFLKEGRFFHFQGCDSWQMGHINPIPFFVIEQFAKDLNYKLIFSRPIGYMPVVDWSNFHLSNIFTAIPRILLYLLMKGPGPIDGNILFYLFQKP